THTGHEYFDDTHAFDLAAGTWAALATTGDRPSPRYKHQVFVDTNVMYVIGGGSYEPEGPDLDAYRLHFAGPKALEWERVRPTGAPPRCRAAHGLAWDRVGRQAFIWGGFTSDMELDSTFCALRLPPLAPAAVTAGPAAAEIGDGDGATVAAAASVSSPVTASATASAAARSASITVEYRGRAGIVEADTSGGNSTRRVLAAGVTRNKPAGGEARSSAAAGTELAEQQQQQQQQQRDPQQRNPQQRNPQQQRSPQQQRNPQQQRDPQQRDPQQQRDQQQRDTQHRNHQQQQQQQQPPASRAEDSRPSRGRHGRERWRRRGHRLLQQEAGELANNAGNSA
ncbi:unnamed protein product, partial [Laminaria digitata]